MTKIVKQLNNFHTIPSHDEKEKKRKVENECIIRKVCHVFSNIIFNELYENFFFSYLSKKEKGKKKKGLHILGIRDLNSASDRRVWLFSEHEKGNAN